MIIASHHSALPTHHLTALRSLLLSVLLCGCATRAGVTYVSVEASARGTNTLPGNEVVASGKCRLTWSLPKSDPTNTVFRLVSGARSRHYTATNSVGTNRLVSWPIQPATLVKSPAHIPFK
jgi:hypothetical protein